jgi:hypothetical protein
VLAVIVVLIIDGLAPFDFTTAAAHFDLWPFMGWFNDGWLAGLQGIDWVQLFGKLFLYGALLWVIRDWGTSTDFALLVLLGVTSSIEVLEIWLPGEHASITDPLLALLVGLSFRSLYRRVSPDLRGTISPRARNR